MIEELNGDFLQWLRGFYYVARTGSVRRAAEKMCRNPSTISYQLRCLEQELNVILFDRYKKSLRITPEGKKLLGWTISTFETLQSMRSSVANTGGDLQGSIVLAATLPIVTLAVAAIVEFTRTHNGVELDIRRGLSADVRRLVADSEVDFGLLPIIARPDMDNLEVIFRARPLLVLRKDNPWHLPDFPDVEDLRRIPYVSFSGGDDKDDLGNCAPQLGADDFIRKNSVIQINNYHLIMRFIWHGLGATIMDELCFQATHYGAEWGKLRTISLEHLFPARVYGILTRRYKHISPQAQALIDALRAHFRSLPALGNDRLWRELRQMESGDPVRKSQVQYLGCGEKWRRPALAGGHDNIAPDD